MIFNDIKIQNEIELRPYKSKQKLSKGDIVEFLYSDTTLNLTKVKNITKGKYIVLKVRNSFFVKEPVYELQSIRKNSKYIFPLFTEAIDFFIDKECIKICNRTLQFRNNLDDEEKKLLPDILYTLSLDYDNNTAIVSWNEEEKIETINYTIETAKYYLENNIWIEIK